MLKPLHPSFIKKNSRLISFKDGMVGRNVILEPNLIVEEEPGLWGYFCFQGRDGWIFRVKDPFWKERVQLSDSDIVQFARDLYSVYCGFYYNDGHINSIDISFAEQKWSMKLPLWALNKTVWLFCNASTQLGHEPQINTKYIENFKKRKIGYR